MARGGARPNSGRPKGNPDETFRKVSLSLSPHALILFDSYASEQKLSRSAAIEKLARLGLQVAKAS
jgi:metal-responsive CopG/Arc/MetJ family transcriptional regulator